MNKLRAPITRAVILVALFTSVVLITNGIFAQVDPNPGINDPPDISLPAGPNTTSGTPVAVTPITVSDPDVGAGSMELEIDISDLDGLGPLSVPAGDYGTFSWGGGSGLTSDIEVTTLANLNTFLSTFVYTPPPGYEGVARIIFEIDDQGNTGTGGVLSRTRFIDIDVVGVPNQAPDISLPGTQNTPINTPIAITPITVSDPDVGAGNMEMEIDISDLDGLGPLSVAAGDYGTFTWGAGTNVTSDVLVAPLAAVNTALSSFVYTPPLGFVGQARIIFEIDDQGNTGTGGTLSRTRFIDIFVGIPTSTPSYTHTPTDTATPAPTATPTDTATSAPTNTPSDTATITPTDASTSTPTDTPTPTPTDTPGGPTNTPTNTAVPASVTPGQSLVPSATPTEDPCLNPQPSSGVQGRILETTFGYFEPSYASATNVVLQQGTSWWVVDAQRGFYELWIACRAQNVWVPAGILGPNFDDVWQGAPLPDAGA